MKILVIDIETTGFNHKSDKILEIGIVKLDLKNGCIEPVYNELVCEDGFNFSHSESWIFKNSDLKYEDVLHAKKLDKKNLQTILMAHPVTAWNSDFDFGFLEDRGFFFSKLQCPMKKSTNFFELPGKFGGYKWPSVEEAWNILFPKAKYKEKHRGLDDALHEARIISCLHEQNVLEINEENHDENKYDYQGRNNTSSENKH